jgi:hypothetical protein
MTFIIVTMAILMLLFCAWMLLDCICRSQSLFGNTFGIAEGKYDKMIWIVLILVSAKLFAIGAIAYYLVIKRR